MILPQIRLLRANGLDDDSSIIGLELEPRLSHKEPAGPRPFTWGSVLYGCSCFEPDPGTDGARMVIQRTKNIAPPLPPQRPTAPYP